MRKLLLLTLAICFLAPIIWLEQDKIVGCCRDAVGSICYRVAIARASGLVVGPFSAWELLDEATERGNYKALTLKGLAMEFGSDFQRFMYEEEQSRLGVNSSGVDWSLPHEIEKGCYSRTGDSFGCWVFASQDRADEALLCYLLAAKQGCAEAAYRARRIEWKRIGSQKSSWGKTAEVLEKSRIKEVQARIAKRREGARKWEERERRVQAAKRRQAETELARQPLVYSADEGLRIGIGDYLLGNAYPPPTEGMKAIAVDVVSVYTPHGKLKVPFHGMTNVFMRLAPTSHRLMEIRMDRNEFKDRSELLSEGRRVLSDLGGMYGKKLAGLRFEAPDWPYWPSRKRYVWSGGLPELYKADENQWATSKNVFAISDTKIGAVALQVKLSVVDYDEYALDLVLCDGEMTEVAKKEFETAFAKAHRGVTYDQWNVERRWGTPGIFALNASRPALMSPVGLAGWNLGARVDCRRYAAAFADNRRHARETPVRLSKRVMDCFANLGVATNSNGEVSCVFLSTEDMKDPEDVFKTYERIKTFLISKGMDGHFEEEVHTADEIRLSRSSQSESGPVYTNFCRLSWVDKTRTVLFSVDTFLLPNGDLVMYLSVSKDSPNELEGLWRRCLEPGRVRMTQKE